MEKKTKTVLIVAGESSGDLHAAALVESIRAIDPSIRFFGLGGERMARAGVSLQADLTRYAVVGFLEVFKNLAALRSLFWLTVDQARTQQPDLAILVDYPGFNLRLAEKLFRLNIPVAYYISPQIWAWGKRRIHTIKRIIRKMIVFFAFEETLYRSHGIDVAFVGHPLLDRVRVAQEQSDIRTRLAIPADRQIIALLPGSREKEIRAMLPVMLESARLISQNLGKEVIFLVAAGAGTQQQLFTACCAPYTDIPIHIVRDQTYAVIAASDYALVCSGTATLETAILGKPMAVLYKVQFLTWLLIRLLIRIPFISLVNVVAGKKVVEEFIQFRAHPRRIAAYSAGLLQDRPRLERMRRELAETCASLGQSGASDRAARVIVDLLYQIDNSHR